MVSTCSCRPDRAWSYDAECYSLMFFCFGFVSLVLFLKIYTVLVKYLDCYTVRYNLFQCKQQT